MLQLRSRHRVQRCSRGRTVSASSRLFGSFLLFLTFKQHTEVLLRRRDAVFALWPSLCSSWARWRGRCGLGETAEEKAAGAALLSAIRHRFERGARSLRLSSGRVTVPSTTSLDVRETRQPRARTHVLQSQPASGLASAMCLAGPSESVRNEVGSTFALQRCY